MAKGISLIVSIHLFVILFPYHLLAKWVYNVSILYSRLFNCKFISEYVIHRREYPSECSYTQSGVLSIGKRRPISSSESSENFSGNSKNNSFKGVVIKGSGILST